MGGSVEQCSSEFKPDKKTQNTAKRKSHVFVERPSELARYSRLIPGHFDRQVPQKSRTGQELSVIWMAGTERRSGRDRFPPMDARVSDGNNV